MKKISNERTETELLPAIGWIKVRFNDGLYAGSGKIARGFFILAAVFVMLCPLVIGSCSKEEKSEPAPPPVAATPAKQAPPVVQPSPVVQPPKVSPKPESPPKPPVQEVVAERYLDRMALTNVGIAGISGALDITGDVTNHGDLIVDEVEISINYCNDAGEIVFTDRHKLIGESPSPLPLLPGQMRSFEYKINSEYYAKAPDLKVEITDLHFILPKARAEK